MNGINYNDTENAIERLVTQGSKINIDTVRAELGNTGSRTTIVKHMKKWRDLNPSIPIKSSNKIELPRAVVLAIDKVIKEKTDEIKKEYEYRIEEAEDDVSSLSKELSFIENKFQEQSESFKNMELQLRTEKMLHEKLMTEVVKENKLLIKKIELLEEKVKKSEQNEAVAIARLEGKDDMIKSMNDMLLSKNSFDQTAID